MFLTRATRDAYVSDLMSSTRSFLFAALALIGFLLWQAWDQDYGAKPAVSQTGTSAVEPNSAKPASTGETPEIPKPAGTAAAIPTPAVTAANEAQPAALIDVQTDLLHLSVDTRGGALVRADLLAYPQDPSD